MLPFTAHIVQLIPISAIVAILALSTKLHQRRRRQILQGPAHSPGHGHGAVPDIDLHVSPSPGARPSVWDVHQVSVTPPTSFLEAVATSLPPQFRPFFLWLFSPLPTALWSRGSANLHSIAQVARVVLTTSGILIVYILSDLASTVIAPASSLFLVAKIQGILHGALKSGTMDVNRMVVLVFANTLVHVLKHFIDIIGISSRVQMQRLLRGSFTAYMIKARARLDLPTLNAQNASLETLDNWEKQENAWNMLGAMSNAVAKFLSMLATLFIVFKTIKDHSNFLSLTAFVLITTVSRILDRRPVNTGVWWAKSTNEDFNRIRALKNAAHGGIYRQDIVAGNMQGAIACECDRLSNKIGLRSLFQLSQNDIHTDRYLEYQRELRRIRPIILQDMTPLFVALLALRSLDTLPSMMTALHVLQDAMRRFEDDVARFIFQMRNCDKHAEQVDALLASGKISNEVKDGTQPFPEHPEVTAAIGIKVEFQNVTFKYPGEEKNSLTNVSFVIEAGQVVVFMGENGAGKSTILHLLARIYDPTEGTILLDDQDIRSLRLEDLRNAMAVTFGSSTVLPLTIRDNILGVHNPEDIESKRSLDTVIQGADISFVHNMKDGLDTYYGYDPAPLVFSPGTSKEQQKALCNTRGKVQVSTGEQKKLLFARLLKRTTGKNAVGLVMLDEPFTSIDAKTKPKLLDSVLNARGGKTMIMITHDFLPVVVRLADTIILLQNGQVVLQGTHGQLSRDRRYTDLLNAGNKDSIFLAMMGWTAKWMLALVRLEMFPRVRWRLQMARSRRLNPKRRKIEQF